MVLQFMWKRYFLLHINYTKTRFLFMYLTDVSFLLSFFFYPCQSQYSSFFTVFDSISSNSNINMVFSINLSGKVFIFKVFNADYKDWLNFSDELIGLEKFVVIFTNLKALTFRTWIWDWDLYIPVLFYFNFHLYLVIRCVCCCYSS